MATRPTGAGLDTADCRHVWHGGNEERAEIPSVRQHSSSTEEQGTRPPLSRLLSQYLAYVAPEIGWPLFVPDVMVPRAADYARKVCTSAQSRASSRFGCLALCDAHVSPAQASPHSTASSRGRQIGLRLLQ